MEYPTAHIGHLVLLTSFIANTITSGMGYANSAYYYGHWLETFHEDSWLTSMIGSLNIAAVCLAGPLAGVMINKLGYRLTVLIGGLLSVAGLIGSAFSVNVYCLLVVYCLVGVGWGLTFISLCIVFAHYYEPKYHGICAGIISSGAGLGHFLTPPIIDKLTEHYTWRGSLLVQAGISAHILLLAASIRTVPSMKQTESTGTFRLKLFRNTDFLFTLVQNLFFTTAISVIFVHFGYCIERYAGVDAQHGALAVSVMGLVSLFGKLIHGFLTKLRCVNAILQVVVSCLLAGVSTIIIPFTSSFLVVICLSVIIGFSLGPYGSVLIVIILTLVSSDDAPSAYGYLNFTGGVGLYIGAPIAGALYDRTRNYLASMLFSGVMFFLAGLVFVRLAVTWQRRMRDVESPVETGDVETPLRDQHDDLTLEDEL